MPKGAQTPISDCRYVPDDCYVPDQERAINMNCQTRQTGTNSFRHSGIALRSTMAAGILTLVLVIGMNTPGVAQTKKPYDEQLFRLSELLGAMHYLRELCGSNEGQLWRVRMRDIMKAEGSSAKRRVDLTRKFNFGYRSYSRTYHKCTPSAKIAISRFINEAAVISDTMVRNIK